MQGPDDIPSPTRRDRLMTAALFPLLLAMLWWMGVARPGALAFAAGLTAAAWLVSLLLNRDVKRAAQFVGALISGLLGAVWLTSRLGASPLALGCALGSIGIAVAMVACVSARFGNATYRMWMHAAAPVGWTLSRFVLAMTYYLVLTPIGLIGRLFGYDPMRRKADPKAQSYWDEHRSAEDVERYFRQY